jgi:mono/diheme cytochrome c family protein
LLPDVGRWTLGVGRSSARAVVIAAASLALAGCRQDMHDAPSYDPLQQTDFFANGAASRTLVANTVARGQLRVDEHFYTGKVNGQVVTEFPMPVTEDMLNRGQERFNVYCSPCHGRTGQGDGMIVQRGFRAPPSYHEERLRNAPVGYFFDVMTNGFGAMQDYSAQVTVPDRWAIAAYIRALQLSRQATVEDVPADRRGDLDRPADAPAKPAQENRQP